MTEGTDFVGKYSAYIRGKDVAASDRRGKQRLCQKLVYSSANKTDAIVKLSLLFYLPSNMQTSYLVKDTAVSHHSSLRVHVLVWPLPLDGHNPLYLCGDDDLPDQLGRQILSE